MADEFNTSPNWWDSSRISINTAGSSSSNSSSGLNTNLGSFGWPIADHHPQMVDMKPSPATAATASTGRSSMDSVSVSDHSTNNNNNNNNSVLFQDIQKLQLQDDDQNHLHMMALGLSSQPIDWNQALLTREDQKPHENSFRSMLQENLNSNASYNNQQEMTSSSSPSSQVQWMREKIMFPIGDHNNISPSRGFSLDYPHHQSQLISSSSTDSTVTCQGLPSSTSNFQSIDSNHNTSASNLYGSPILQGLLVSDPHRNHHHHQSSSFDQNRSSSLMSYHNHDHYGGLSNSNSNYGMINSSPHEELILPSSWSNSNKVGAQFLRTSPPKQQHNNNNQLHFSNNAPFWNASAPNSVNNFFSSSAPPTQYPTTNFEEKPKSDSRDSSSLVKKGGNDHQPTPKRPRNETASPLPAFKVRKEKMGDRVTALQQLVSPFGKTDTASVLSEAIEYIKFLHQQVTVLSTPYMKSGVPLQHQQNSEKSKDSERNKPDLRSRGLCLVPISSTYPVTHETTVDFWTPTFGGTFR